MISAIIFDLDGTLVDSSIDFERMKRLVVEKLAEQGVPDGLLSMELNLVENMEGALGYLESQGDGHDAAVWEEIEELLKEVEMESIHRSTAISGADEALSSLREKGYRVGILTRASRKYSLISLDNVGIREMIEGMVCRDDYPWFEAKPHPISVARICSSIGVRSDSCIIVGDHYIDRLCAMRSGSRFVGVLTGYFDSGMWLDKGVSEFISSVSELPEYLALLDGGR